MSKLTQDGTAKPVSRDQILRRERGQGNIHSLCSADHEQVWQSYPVDPYSDDFTYILYLYIQQYQYICTICTMNAAVEPIHILSVHSYHDTVSAALLSSPVISTNEDQRILIEYAPIAVSYTWEMTSVSMCYSQGDGFNNSLFRLLRA